MVGVWSTGTFDYIKQTKAAINDAWYGEIKDYNFSNPGFSEATGHFTQVVWKNSKRLGCAWNQKTCKSNNLNFYKFVCEYDPPGNVGGQYAANVPRPVGGGQAIYVLQESGFKNAEFVPSSEGVLYRLNDSEEQEATELKD